MRRCPWSNQDWRSFLKGMTFFMTPCHWSLHPTHRQTLCLKAHFTCQKVETNFYLVLTGVRHYEQCSSYCISFHTHNNCFRKCCYPNVRSGTFTLREGHYLLEAHWIWTPGQPDSETRPLNHCMTLKQTHFNLTQKLVYTCIRMYSSYLINKVAMYIESHINRKMCNINDDIVTY